MLVTPRGAQRAERARLVRPRVAIVSTGGTIASVGRDRLDLTGYAETDEMRAVGALLAELPELATIADVTPVELPNVPSHALGLSGALDVARAVRGLAADPAVAGVVVTHGTNTLEETAFLLDLLTPPGTPVVVTGAMRPATGLSADGPMNLLNAVRLAADPAARERGVLVLLDDTVHAARDATKTSASRLSAFRGGDLGPLGFVEGDGVVLFHHEVAPWAARGAFAPPAGALPRVDVVVSYLGADGALVDAAVAAGAAGIVCAGTGAGYPTPAQSEALDRAAARGVVVCQATRVPSGRVTPRAGLLTAGSLNPWKARLLLALALTRTRDTARIQRLLDR
ncbi:asparaginase [Phytohabitans suffuscus]|uniref:asparaginase n=1 Tax=Phytohabitans suffuscus TaxID=624315 RepID=A0A6F8YW70_9ACTN|nr:asparaginase [Phytohabitans suffuscus]BCB90101.1 L-asparaginase [Phytohabitans suffuscus]